MTDTPENKGFEETMNDLVDVGSERRLLRQYLRGYHGEGITDFDTRDLSPEEKKAMLRVNKLLGRVNITSFFSVLSQELSEEKFMDTYIADKERKKGSVDTAVDVVGFGSNEARKKEQKAVKELFEIFKEKKHDKLNPYLEQLEALSQFSVHDDAEALQYMIVYQVYINETAPSMNGLDMLIDISLDGTVDDNGILDEPELETLRDDAITALGDDGEQKLYENIYALVGIKVELGTPLKSLELNTQAAVLQKFHAWLKNTPPRFQFRLLVEGPTAMGKIVEEKKIIEANKRMSFFEAMNGNDEVKKLMGKVRESVPDMEEQFQAPAVKFIEGFEGLSREQKSERVWAILTGFNPDASIRGLGGAASILNPLKKNPESFWSRISINLGGILQATPAPDGESVDLTPTVVVGVSYSGGNDDPTKKVNHFYNFSAGRGMSFLGIQNGETVLTTTQGVQINLNTKDHDGYGNDARKSISTFVNAGVFLERGELKVAAGIRYERDKLQGHELELAAAEGNIKDIIDAMTEGVSIKDCVDLLQRELSKTVSERKVRAKQGEIEDLAQFVYTQVGTYGLDDYSTVRDVLADAMIYSLDEAGLLKLKSGEKSFYLKRLGAVKSIVTFDMSNMFKTMWDIMKLPIKLLPVNLLTATGTTYSDISYTPEVRDEDQIELENISTSRVHDFESRETQYEEALQKGDNTIELKTGGNNTMETSDMLNTLMYPGATAIIPVGGSDYLGFEFPTSDPTQTLEALTRTHGVDYAQHCEIQEYQSKMYFIVPNRLDISIQTFNEQKGTDAVDKKHVLVLGDTGIGEGQLVDEAGRINLSETDNKERGKTISFFQTGNPGKTLGAYDTDLFEKVGLNAVKEKVEEGILRQIYTIEQLRGLDFIESVELKKNIEGLYDLVLLLDRNVEGKLNDTKDLGDAITIPAGSTLNGRYSKVDKKWKVSVVNGDGKLTVYPLNLSLQTIKSFTSTKEVPTVVPLEELPEAYTDQRETNKFSDLLMELRYTRENGVLKPNSNKEFYKKYLEFIQEEEYGKGLALLKEKKSVLEKVYDSTVLDKRLSNIDPAVTRVVLKQIEGDLSLTYMTQYKHLNPEQAKDKILGTDGLLKGVTGLSSEEKAALTLIIEEIYVAPGKQVEIFKKYQNSGELLALLESGLPGFRFDMNPGQFYWYLLSQKTKPLAQIAFMLMPASMIMNARSDMFEDALKNLGETKNYRNEEKVLWKKVESEADASNALASKKGAEGTGIVSKGKVGLVATYESIGRYKDGSTKRTMKRKQAPNPRMEDGTFVKVEDGDVSDLNARKRQYLNALFDNKTDELLNHYIKNIKIALGTHVPENFLQTKEELINFMINPKNGEFDLLYGMYGPCKNRLMSHEFGVNVPEISVTTLKAADTTPLYVELPEKQSTVRYGQTMSMNDPSKTGKDITLITALHNVVKTRNLESGTRPVSINGLSPEEAQELQEQGGLDFGTGTEVTGDFLLGDRLIENATVSFDPSTGNISINGIEGYVIDNLIIDASGSRYTAQHHELIAQFRLGKFRKISKENLKKIKKGIRDLKRKQKKNKKESKEETME